MESKEAILLSILKREIAPATGCTEPVAVAYSTAVARENLDGIIERVEIKVDGGLFKNGVRVGIPGIKERGIDIAGALGLFAGSVEKGLQVIDDISPEALDKAKTLVAQGKVKVSVLESCPRLYIETILYTSTGKVRILTTDRHINVVRIDDGVEQVCCEVEDSATIEKGDSIKDYTLEDFIEFSESVSIDDISFLQEGVDFNMALAEEGLTYEEGVGKKLESLVEAKLIGEDLIYRAQLLCAAASEARMAGSKKAAMSTAGSGNHGITLFLTCYAVAEKMGVSKEKLLRALALSNLITFYIKAFTGTLSAMCGCGIAAGIGASAGVVYMLDGDYEEILGTIINMIGSITGLVCDGGKEGCSYKLALSAGWAVQSALLSKVGAIANTRDGILAPDFETVVKNMGYVCSPGMHETNKAIIKVMTQN